MDHLARRVALRFTNAHKSASRPSDPKAYMHKYVDPKFDSTLGTLKEFSVQLGVLKGSLMELMSDVPETQDLAGELREIVSKEHLHLTPMKDAMVKKIVALQKLMGSLGSDKTAGEVNVPKLDRLVESIEKEVKQMRTSLDLYTKDPGKYKPQLDNLANAASTVESTVGVIHRLIDKA